MSFAQIGEVPFRSTGIGVMPFARLKVSVAEFVIGNDKTRRNSKSCVNIFHGGTRWPEFGGAVKLGAK